MIWCSVGNEIRIIKFLSDIPNDLSECFEMLNFEHFLNCTFFSSKIARCWAENKKFKFLRPKSSRVRLRICGVKLKYAKFCQNHACTFWILTFELDFWQHFWAQRLKAEIEYFKVSYKKKWNSIRQSGKNCINKLHKYVWWGPIWQKSTFFPFCLVRFHFILQKFRKY